MPIAPTLASLAADLESGRTTARKLVEDCLARIAEPAGEGSRTFIHVDRDMATVMDHHSVGAGVHPIRIEVPRHDRAAGANVASAVQFVPERRWKSQHIDFSALLDILEHRSALHDNRLAFCCLGLPDAWLVA